MAWPFTNVGAPNLDTGPGASVPLVLTAITPSLAWLLGADFTNTDGSNSIQITITDTAGNIIAQVTLPPGGEQPYEWPLKPVLGVKWLASGANVKGHIWGYK